MVEEARVLHGDDGLAHDRRDGGERHLDAVLVVDRRHDRAVRGQDHGALGQVGRIELRRQRLEAVDRATREEPGGGGHGQHHGRGDGPGYDGDEEEDPQAAQCGQRSRGPAAGPGGLLRRLWLAHGSPWGRGASPG